MSNLEICPTCQRPFPPPPDARPMTHYCPVCGKQYPQDGSCDYGHPNVDHLLPIPDPTAIGFVEGSPADALADQRTGEGTVTDDDQPPPAAEQAVVDPADGSEPAPAADQAPGALQPSQPEGADAPAPVVKLADPVHPQAVQAPEPAAEAEPCPTCRGAGVVPAPPPAGEVLCPTCSGTGKAPVYA